MLPLLVLGMFLVVSLGNAEFGAMPEWRVLRALSLFGTCVGILWNWWQLTHRLSAARSEGAAPGLATAWTSLRGAHLVGVVLALLLVVLGGNVPGTHIIHHNVGFLMLLPTTLLLLRGWWRARRSLLLSVGLSVGYSRREALASQATLLLEELLFELTLVAAVVVALVAMGNALWWQDDRWLRVRPYLHGSLAFVVLALLHRRGSQALSAIALSARHSFEQSRDWGEDVDSVRDLSWATAQILAALAVAPGMRVADIGAGGGYFALKLAQQVGPTGLVLATDVAEESVARLRRRADQMGLTQLRVKHVSRARPLPAGSEFDRVLVANVFLFSLDRPREGCAYLKQFAGNLLPNGRLVLFNEFVHEKGWRPSPDVSPEEASQPDAAQVIAWAQPWFALEQSVATPPPSKPFDHGETSGYLITMRRRPVPV